MNINVLDNGDISIPYMRSNSKYQFTDAIILKPDDFAILTPDDIKTMQDNRFTTWLEHVETASNQPATEDQI